jgi:ABC-type polysaccharide/polyol phosphate export permease
VALWTFFLGASLILGSLTVQVQVHGQDWESFSYVYFFLGEIA